MKNAPELIKVQGRFSYGKHSAEAKRSGAFICRELYSNILDSFT